MGSSQEDQEEPPCLLLHCRRSRNHHIQIAEGSHFASCPERKVVCCTAPIARILGDQYLEASDVPVAEVLAQVLHLLQFKEVDAKHLDGPHHQVVHLLVLSEEGLLVPLLVLHKGLDVLVKAVAGRAFRGLGGELALLKEESEEGEEGVLVDLPLVRLELGLVRF